jgi:hypothetical protein
MLGRPDCPGQIDAASPAIFPITAALKYGGERVSYASPAKKARSLIAGSGDSFLSMK